MERKYEHIFFDLDRTLWHFDENSRKVLGDIYHKFHLYKYIDLPDDFISVYEIINEELWTLYRNGKIAKENLRSERFHQTLLKFKFNNEPLADEIGTYYVDNSPLQTILLPFAIDVLEHLKGRYQMHIITNGFEEIQLIKLNNSKIEHYFDQVIFSEKVGVKKPHPLIFKQAIKGAGATFENSLMIGDDFYADICGAQRVKMDSIYFNYNKTVHNYKIDREINCLSELFEIL